MTALEALIIAGPNGSGKSTLTARLGENGIALPATYLNSDEITLNLREQEPKTAQGELEKRAQSEGRRLRQEYRHQRIPFVFETVFSHPSSLMDMRDLRDAGYRITLAVVTTADPEINVRRVAQRVATGGHGVPEEKIRERYKRFMHLLPRIVEMADRSLVFDASDDIRLCYRRERVELKIAVPDYIRAALLDPLSMRAQSSKQVLGRLSSEETVQSVDELSGSYEGIIRICTPHHTLQDIASGECALHDRLLLMGEPAIGERVRIFYKEGVGTMEGEVKS